MTILSLRLCLVVQRDYSEMKDFQLKGQDKNKNKTLSSFTETKDPNLNDVLSSAEHRRYVDECWSPSTSIVFFLYYACKLTALYLMYTHFYFEPF